jgi:hypothetical protein
MWPAEPPPSPYEFLQTAPRNILTGKIDAVK